MKKIIMFGTLLTCLILITPIMSSNNNALETPIIEPISAFKLIFYPPLGLIVPDDGMIEINGVHQLIPGSLERFLPTLWMSQYTVIEIVENPDWLYVNIPEPYLITPPDGVEYQIYMVIAISEYAPMNTYETLELSITSGKFMRNIFPSWFPLCNEFKMNQSITFQTGEW